MSLNKIYTMMRFLVNTNRSGSLLGSLTKITDQGILNMSIPIDIANGHQADIVAYVEEKTGLSVYRILSLEDNNEEK